MALHFDDELPWGAVAATLGFSVSTVKRRATEAREKLRKELVAHGVDASPRGDAP